ncbi:MAG: PEGA domain-containing protein [Acidobacteria bacterium]|nr:PEGA domain-containing protein [Acidobacteriota bacterium]MBI3662684.1 PEGA domain-containing protein [Acidobacteriota bacterium]
MRNPDAVAVVIGIAEYQLPDVPKVEFAVNDAQAIRQMLIQTLGYSESRALLRPNADVSMAKLHHLIRRQLRDLVVPGKSDVFVYYSGHGAPSPDTREAFLIPWDYDPNYLPTADTAYPLKDFYTDLAKLNARSVTVVLDACFSGQSEGGAVLKDIRPVVITVESPAATLPNGVVITATGAQGIASSHRESRHGLLTYFLLQALRGEAADEKGRVTVAALERYLKENVIQEARKRSRSQEPQVASLDAARVLAELPRSAVKAGKAVVVQKYGSLEITTDVGGDLYIDGVRQDTLRAGQAFVQQQIEAGPHQIEIRKPGYESKREEIVVPPDRKVQRDYALTPTLPTTPIREKAYGTIQVSSDAGGTLFIDEQKIADLSPFEKYTTARIEAGPHQVRISREGYRTNAQEVVVRPNETAKLDLTMPRIAIAVAKAPEAKKDVYPSPTGIVLFEDDFESKRNMTEYSTDKYCRTFYSQGGYVVRNVSQLSSVCYLNYSLLGILPANVRIDSDVTLLAGATNSLFGLRFGARAGDSFYVFGISGDGSYKLSRFEEGKWRDLVAWTKDDIVKTGAQVLNHLAVEIRGRTIRYFIDGRHLGSVDVTADVEGTFGLHVDTPGMEVLFDNLRIISLSGR